MFKTTSGMSVKEALFLHIFTYYILHIHYILELWKVQCKTNLKQVLFYSEQVWVVCVYEHNPALLQVPLFMWPQTTTSDGTVRDIGIIFFWGNRTMLREAEKNHWIDGFLEMHQVYHAFEHAGCEYSWPQTLLLKTFLMVKIALKNKTI